METYGRIGTEAIKKIIFGGIEVDAEVLPSGRISFDIDKWIRLGK
jgi:hypothetical protein